MKVEFKGSYKNKITKTSGLWLNTIELKLKTGEVVTLDRDEDEYTLEKCKANIMFRGAYVWTGEVQDYDLVPEDFDGAEIIGYDVEDDAPEGYDLEITIPQNISAW